MRFSDVKTLRQLFQVRPAAVPLVEKAVGGGCWAHLDQPLDLFCTRYGVMPSDLLDRVAALPEPEAEINWDDEPLYRLVDRLSADHREFREVRLPALRSALELQGLPAYPDRYVAGLMLQDFQSFGRAFLGHMSEEEEKLFPDALLGDAVLRHPGLALKPSSRPLHHSRPETPDDVFSRMATDIREKIRLQPVSPASLHRFAAIASDFQAFEEKLRRHGALENDVLGPRLARIEEALGGVRS